MESDAIQVNSVRTELNDRTLSWCHRELLVVGNLPIPLPHTHLVSEVVSHGSSVRVKEKHRTEVLFTQPQETGSFVIPISLIRKSSHEEGL